MAGQNLTVAQEQPAGPLLGNELCRIVQNGSSCRTTLQDIVNLAAGGAGVTAVTAGSGLTGGTITSTGTIGLANTAVTPGTYGDNTHVGQFTVDQQGRITSAVLVPISGGGGGLPTGNTNPSKLGTSNLNTAVWIRDVVDAGNSIFGDINASPRATIQAAVDYCFANGYKTLRIPLGNGGAQYTLDGPIYFDPPANLRSGISLANQKLGVFAVPSVFGEGLEVICDWGTSFKMNWNSSCCLIIGTQNNNRLWNARVQGPRADLGTNLKLLDPRCIAFGIAAGNGGAVNTSLYNCYCDDVYGGAVTGMNGQSALAENNSFYDCQFFAAISWDPRNSQAFVNKFVGGNHFGALYTFNDRGQGTLIEGGEGGTVGGFQSTLSGLTLSALTAFSDTLPGGTPFNNYWFTDGVSGGGADLDGNFFYNAAVITTANFGVVPIHQYTAQGGIRAWKLDLGWVAQNFGEESAVTASDLSTEVQAVTTILASTRNTLFRGTITAINFYTESPHCQAFYESTGANQSAHFIDMNTTNWTPGSGGDVNTTVAINNRNQACITSNGTCTFDGGTMPAHQQGQPPIVIQFFDDLNNQYINRFIVRNVVGFGKANMRYCGNASTASGTTITKGPGYDNTLTTNAHIATKAFGGGEWDMPPWSYGGNGLNFLEYPAGAGTPPTNLQFPLITGTSKLSFFGYRPATNQHQRITTADLSALFTLGSTGNIPFLCGGYPAEVAQIGTVSGTAGGPATSNIVGVHRVIDVGGAGWSWYAGGNRGASLGIPWQCKGKSSIVLVNVGGAGATNANYLFQGLEIGLNTDSTNLYIVTGLYLYETAPYITVMRTNTANTIISGTNTTVYTGSTMSQRVPVISAPGQAITARVSTQFDKTSSTTLADVTGLSLQGYKGLSGSFRAVLFTTSNVAGGVKAAISGTATASAIIYEGETTDPAGTQVLSRTTTLGNAVGAVTAVTAARIEITGEVTFATTGTLTVQFAQNASNGSASSVLVGSFLQFVGIP